MHKPAAFCFHNVHAQWLSEVVWPALSRPLRIVHSEIRGSRDVRLRPVMNHSLVVLPENIDHGWFELALYAEHLRAANVRHVGLLHTWNDRVCPDQLPSSTDARYCRPRDAAFFLQLYSAFDIVLRQFFVPSLAASSLYLPLGPTSRDLPQLPGAAADAGTEATPRASSRGRFCIGLFGVIEPDYSYDSDRTQLLRELGRWPSRLCAVRELHGRAYRETLRDAAFSLCPWGANPETHRLWESVLAGAIVVVRRSAFLRELQAPPFVVLEAWEELFAALEPYRRNATRLDELQRAQARWLGSLVLSVGSRVRAVEDAIFSPA